MIALLQDGNALVRRIAEVSGESISVVRDRIAQENAWPGSAISRDLEQRKVVPYQWSDGMAAYYAQSNAGLYEAVIWNRSLVKSGLRRWISERLDSMGSGIRVLCIGDGMGFDGTTFAAAGHAVTSFEVSESARRFAEGVSRDFDLAVRFSTDLADLPTGGFDAVVCLDVLEHLQNPSLTVNEIARLLTDDGLAYINAPFWLVGPFHKTHLASNMELCRQGSGFYEAAGLYVVGGRWFWDPVVLSKKGERGTPVLMEIAHFFLRVLSTIPFLTSLVIFVGYSLRRPFCRLGFRGFS